MKRVRDFVIENFLYGDDKRLREDTSFIEHGIIDSTGVVELASFLQETFKISIDDNEMVPENLDSLKDIERFIARKTSKTPFAQNGCADADFSRNGGTGRSK